MRHITSATSYHFQCGGEISARDTAGHAAAGHRDDDEWNTAAAPPSRSTIHIHAACTPRFSLNLSDHRTPATTASNVHSEHSIPVPENFHPHHRLPQALRDRVQAPNTILNTPGCVRRHNISLTAASRAANWPPARSAICTELRNQSPKAPPALAHLQTGAYLPQKQLNHA